MTRTAQMRSLGKVWISSPLSFPCDCAKLWLVWAVGERIRYTHRHDRQAPLTSM